MQIFSERLLLLRKKKGLSQEELAAQAGIAYRSYRRYESGEREPSVSAVVVLARFFSVSTDYLLGFSDKE